MKNLRKTFGASFALSVLLSMPVSAQIVQTESNSSLYQSTQACLTFEDVLKLSAQRDPNVLIARAQESEAESEIKEAKSLFRPQISAFGRSGFGDTGIIDSGVSNQLGLRASQRVFDFGDSKFAKQAANYGYEARLEDTRQTQAVAAQRTGLFYLELIEAEEQITLTERRRDYFSEQLIATDNLLRDGAATRTERAAIASQLADAEAFVLEIKFRKEQAQTQIRIDTETNSPLCTNSQTPMLLTQKFRQLNNPENATQIALNQNPFIKSLEQTAKRLEAEKKREKRSRLPIIDVVATGSYSSIGGFDRFEFRDRIGVDVSVPLYSGNAIGARNQRAAARESIGRGQVLDAKRQLRKDVDITFRRILSLEERLESRYEVEKQTRLQLEAAETEREIGTKTLRDLVEIRLEYEQAGLERIRTKYDLMRQQLQLLTLTNRLMNGGV